MHHLQKTGWEICRSEQQCEYCGKKNSAPDKKEKCSISDIYFGLFVAVWQSKSDIASMLYCSKVVKWLKNNFTGVG